MTTDVQKHEAQLPEVMQGTGGEPDVSDFSIPYVKLVQASSEEVKDGTAKPGVFLSSEGEKVESIAFVPLHIQFTRDFYDADAGKAICGSTDRLTGHPRDLTYFRTHGDLNLADGDPLACRDCPFYEMDQFAKTACKKTYAITCYDTTTDAPFMYRVRGSAMGVFRNRFIGAVAMKRAVPWARAFQMTSAKKSNGGNSWFAPELQPIQSYTEEEMGQWAAMAAGYGESRPASADFDDLPFE